MKWTVGRKLALGFGIALAVFVLVGYFSYRSLNALVSAAEERAVTYETRRALMEDRLTIREIQVFLRNYVLTGEEGYRNEFDKALGAAPAFFKETRDLVKDQPPLLNRLVRMNEIFVDTYIPQVKRAMELRRAGSQQQAIELMLSAEVQKSLNEMIRLIEDVDTQLQAQLKARIEESNREVSVAQSTTLFGNLAGLLLALVAAVLITRDISGPLRSLTASTERITVGDLSAQFTTGARSDEIGALSDALARMSATLRGMAGTAEQIAAGDLRGSVEPLSKADVLGNAFARMADGLRKQIGGMVEGANILGSSASQIVASTAQLAASASESAAAVTETTATVEEVRQTAQLASQKARNVSDIAQKAVEVSDTGRKATQDMEAGMLRIRRQMEQIAASMMRLSEQSQAVGQIIATVEDIATQSNLLAVNAAIEAAKAGAHGSGFGVVAQEVKSLAEQSRQATGQVRAILGDIQKATASAVLATEEGSKAVESGIRQGEASGGAIQALGTSVKEAAQAATQIVASSQQQFIGVDQVAGAMENIRQASAQNVASATQLETTARDLEQLGQRLKQMVALYQL